MGIHGWRCHRTQCVCNTRKTRRNIDVELYDKCFETNGCLGLDLDLDLGLRLGLDLGYSAKESRVRSRSSHAHTHARIRATNYHTPRSHSATNLLTLYCLKTLRCLK